VQQVWAVMMKKTISIKPALLPIYNTVLLLLVAVHCLLEEKEDTTKRFAVQITTHVLVFIHMV
jgi:hypothetical protein